jgi:hypothetical protein
MLSYSVGYSTTKGHDFAAAVMASELVGVPGLEPGTSSLSGCRRSGSASGFDVVSWAYARSARFSYLAMSCAYTRAPWRTRATVGPTLGPGTFRSVGVGGSSRIVRCGPRAGPTFRSCQPGAGVVQRLGSSIGSSRGGTALFLARPFFRPDISQLGADLGSVMRYCWSLLSAVGRCCCCHRCCHAAVAGRTATCRFRPRTDASAPGTFSPRLWSWSACLLTTLHHVAGGRHLDVRVVLHIANAEVAAVAQETTYLAGFVIVVKPRVPGLVVPQIAHRPYCSVSSLS